MSERSQGDERRLCTGRMRGRRAPCRSAQYGAIQGGLRPCPITRRTVTMTKLIHQIRKTAAYTLLIVSSLGAQAAKPPDWTEAELDLIAPYCIDTMGWKYGDASTNTSPRAKHWVGLMGPGFWAMHHYCVAILNLKRLSRHPKAEWPFRYQEVINDLEYVVRNTKPDFVMLPEVFSRIGEVELLRKDLTAAGKAFERARLQRPDYVPAYTLWAQTLDGLGKRSDALALVREGLSHAPQSKPLLNLYKQFGGDPARLLSPAVKATADAVDSSPNRGGAAPEATAASASATAQSTPASSP